MNREEIAQAREDAIRKGSATARDHLDAAADRLVAAAERSAREGWETVDRLRKVCAEKDAEIARLRAVVDEQRHEIGLILTERIEVRT